MCGIDMKPTKLSYDLEIRMPTGEHCLMTIWSIRIVSSGWRKEVDGRFDNLAYLRVLCYYRYGLFDQISWPIEL